RDEALTLMKSGINDRLMADFRQPMDDFSKSIEQLLADRAAEARSAQSAAYYTLFGGAAITVLLSMLLGWLLLVGIAKPVAAMTAVMRRLAGGDNAVEIPAQDCKDEIGQMAQAVCVFRDAAIEKRRLEGEAAGQQQAAEAERARNEAARAESARQ